MIKSMISYREYMLFLLIVLPFSVAFYIEQVLITPPPIEPGMSKEMALMFFHINRDHGIILAMGHYILSTLPLAFWAGVIRRHPSLLFSCCWAAGMYFVVKLCQLAV